MTPALSAPPAPKQRSKDGEGAELDVATLAATLALAQDDFEDTPEDHPSGAVPAQRAQQATGQPKGAAPAALRLQPLGGERQQA